MVTHKQLENGFKYLEIKNTVAEAKVALQGAHIFEYKSKQNLLWLSESSPFEEGKALRGGIPLCWPAFGSNNPKLPQHGFARTAMFTLINVDETQQNKTILKLRLEDDVSSIALWNYHFELTLTIIIADTLTLQLHTTNKDTKPFKLTQAFHTYFDISNISDVSIEGLDKKPYFDALDAKQKYQDGIITFDKEFDSVFQDVPKIITLKDTHSLRKIESKGSSSCVVWNPWIEKCSRMSGMRKNAYKEFVCIETANAYDDFKLLYPQESHSLEVTFTSL